MEGYHFFSICIDEDLQKLDDLGVQIEMLLIAQNQSISKLNQLIRILQQMINGTDSGNTLNMLFFSFFSI